MNKTQKIPIEIRKIQHWFADCITQPLDNNDKMKVTTLKGENIKDTAHKYIKDSTTLKSYECLEIYNQQYWFRLLEAMRVNFPLTFRVVGARKFKHLASLYLSDNPPNHWSLRLAGNRFFDWIKTVNVQSAITHCIELDSLFHSCFTSHSNPVPTSWSFNSSLEILIRIKLCLQGHVRLVCYPYDILKFRKEVLNNEIKDVMNELQKLTNTLSNYHYYILYRNKKIMLFGRN